MGYEITDHTTLSEFQRVNAQRSKRWHKGGLEEWSALEWAGAMAGEAGEACNAAKKLRRVDLNLQNIDERGQHTIDEYKMLVAKEVADTIIYGMILMSLMGVDAEQVIRDVFNKKSEEYNFPERL